MPAGRTQRPPDSFATLSRSMVCHTRAYNAITKEDPPKSGHSPTPSRTPAARCSDSAAAQGPVDSGCPVLLLTFEYHRRAETESMVAPHRTRHLGRPNPSYVSYHTPVMSATNPQRCRLPRACSGCSESAAAPEGQSAVAETRCALTTQSSRRNAGSQTPAFPPPSSAASALATTITTRPGTCNMSGLGPEAHFGDHTLHADDAQQPLKRWVKGARIFAAITRSVCAVISITTRPGTCTIRAAVATLQPLVSALAQSCQTMRPPLIIDKAWYLSQDDKMSVNLSALPLPPLPAASALAHLHR